MKKIITCPCGAIRGTASRHDGVTAYKGIRYATAGRWEYPQMVTHWDGVYEADSYGNCCWQPRAFYDEEKMPEKAFYYNEFRRGESYTYSEDCLFLNIFAPETACEGDKLPVIFYIHGGGYTGGCGHEKHFDEPVWPTRGIIGVTVNYRLGPLGFACLPELREEAGKCGNYGLYDQLCALDWVRGNISAFGGDKDNITIMGQSAGAMSVQQHCLSPLSSGRFSKAVMSSGGGISSMMKSPPAEKRFGFWKAVMDCAGCSDLAEFRTLSVEKLFEAWQKTKKEYKGGGMAASPCIDGELVAENAEIHDISYMAGSTSEDVMPPLIFSMSRKWCAGREKPSFTWFFDRRLPGDDCGAWHSSDLWYWFGTLDNCWRPMTDKDRMLAEEMVVRLCAFAASGEPNAEGLSLWEDARSSGKKVMRLGERPTAMGKVSMPKLIKTMLTNKAVGE